jgi:hypothetical protein
MADRDETKAKKEAARKEWLRVVLPGRLLRYIGRWNASWRAETCVMHFRHGASPFVEKF